MSFVPTALLEAAEEAHHAPMVAEPWVFAVVAVVAFVVMGFVTFSYRDVANRHSDKVPAGGDHGAGHH